MAAEGGYKDMVECLLENNADVDPQDDTKVTKRLYIITGDVSLDHSQAPGTSCMHV